MKEKNWFRAHSSEHNELEHIVSSLETDAQKLSK